MHTHGMYVRTYFKYKWKGQMTTIYNHTYFNINTGNSLCNSYSHIIRSFIGYKFIVNKPIQQ